MMLIESTASSRSPTPPLPPRHRHHYPLPPIPNSPDSEALVPSPLFIKTKAARHHPDIIRVAVLEIPTIPTSPSSTLPSNPPSPSRSSICSLSSLSSAASSPSSITPPALWSWDGKTSSALPKHTLRRKKSPKRETLRSLRAKESDACLASVYDRQVNAYLNGTLFTPQMGVVEE